MRQLCNLSYSVQVEAFDKEQLRAFDIELALEPGDTRKVSRGSSDLMTLMRGGGGNRGG